VAELDWKPVASSNVAAAAWGGGDLWVRYKSGTYRYAGVPEAVFFALMAAYSKGTFLNQFVKGQYPYERAGG